MPKTTLISGGEVDVLMAATDELCDFLLENGVASRRGLDKVGPDERNAYEAGRWSAIFDYLQLRESGQLAEPEILIINQLGQT